MRLGIHDLPYRLRAGVAPAPSLLVLLEAAFDVGRDAGIEGAVSAEEDVEVVHEILQALALLNEEIELFRRNPHRNAVCDCVFPSGPIVPLDLERLVAEHDYHIVAI